MSHKPEYFASEIIGFGGTGTTGPAGNTGPTGAAGGPIGSTGPAGGPGVATPNVFFAESSTTGTGVTKLGWGTVVKSDSFYTLADSDTKIQISEPGMYLINYQVCIKNLSSGGPLAPTITVSLNPDTSPNQLIRIREPSVYDVQHNLITDSFIAYLTPGDSIEVEQSSSEANIWCFAPHSISVEYIAPFSRQTTSLEFNSTDVINSSGNSLLFNLANAWTIALWVYPGFSLANDDWVFIDRTDDITISHIGRDIRATLTGTGGTKTWTWEDSISNSDIWYHVAVSWDGTDIRAYVNGVNLQEPDTKSPDNSITQADSVGTVALKEASAGLMHSVLAWDVVIGDDGIEALWNDGLGAEIDPLRAHGNYVQHADLQHYWRLGYMPEAVSTSAGSGSLGGKDCGLASPKIHMTTYTGQNNTDFWTTKYPGAKMFSSTDGLGGNQNGGRTYLPPQKYSYHIQDQSHGFENGFTTLGYANEWSIGLWMRPGSNTLDVIFIDVRPTSGVLNRITWEARGGDSAGRMRVSMNDTAGTLFKEYDFDSIFVGNTWVHLIATWDGTDLLLYKNGSVQSATKNTDSAGTRADFSGSQKVGTSAGGTRYEGWYHSFFAWDEAMPASVVAVHYNGGDADFNSYAPQFGTSTAVATPEKNFPSSSAWRFNATGPATDDQYAQGPTMTSLLGATPASFSFSGWVYADGAQQNFASPWGSSTTWTAWDDGFGLYFENDQLVFFVGDYANTDEARAAFPINQWVHVAGAYNGTTSLTLWVDGVSTTTTVGLPATITSGGNLRMSTTGNSGQTLAFFQGWLDEFVLFTDVLTNAEARWMRLRGDVFGNMLNGLAPDNDIVWYRFGDNASDDPTLSTGQLTDCRSGGTNHATPGGVSGTIPTYSMYKFHRSCEWYQRLGADPYDVPGIPIAVDSRKGAWLDQNGSVTLTDIEEEVP